MKVNTDAVFSTGNTVPMNLYVTTNLQENTRVIQIHLQYLNIILKELFFTQVLLKLKIAYMRSSYLSK